MRTIVDATVLGFPATFATAAERPWKEALALQLSDLASGADAVSVELDFAIAARPGYPHGGDLDNLCEPVFSVTAGRLGWFGGRRPNIESWRATKSIAAATSCRIRAYAEPLSVDALPGRALLDARIEGPLPSHAKDRAFADRIRAAMGDRAGPAAPLAVSLAFDGPLNLGDIATGKVKSVIDCLWPVIGGAPGDPDDSRIMRLAVARGDPAAAPAVDVLATEI